MPRSARVDAGGYVYHVLNRANARAQIFDSEQDYKDFEDILEKAVEVQEWGQRMGTATILLTHSPLFRIQCSFHRFV